MQIFRKRLSPIKKKKRWDYDTERDDFDQEEVARAKEDKRKFGITGSVLLRLHFYLNWRLFFPGGPVVKNPPANAVKALVTQSCLTLCNPMDCSLPGSSVHGLLQAGILEWVAIFFSRGSSQPRDITQVSCITGRLFSHLSQCRGHQFYAWSTRHRATKFTCQHYWAHALEPGFVTREASAKRSLHTAARENLSAAIRPHTAANNKYINKNKLMVDKWNLFRLLLQEDKHRMNTSQKYSGSRISMLLLRSCFSRVWLCASPYVSS